MCTFGLFHSWLTTDMEWTNHMGAGSSMLLNAVFSRSSLISTALSLTVFSLCVFCSVLVCVMQRFVLSQPLCRYRDICLPSWFVGRAAAVCMRMCIILLAFWFAHSRSLGAVVSSVYHLPRVYYVSTLFQHAYMCVRLYVLFFATVALSHGVCITSEPSYAGVLLQGSACYILSCVRYGTHFVVYGMRSFRLNGQSKRRRVREMDSVRLLAKHIRKTPLHLATQQRKNRKEQMN